MNVQIQAEKAKDGKIYVFFMDGQVDQNKILIAIINGDSAVKWVKEGSDIVQRAIV
jgi:hypothetical protein